MRLSPLPVWPYSLGVPQAKGVIRSSPEDFLVEEIPNIHPQGEGSHVWLWVEKRLANTDWVAGELAKAVECRQRDVGFAGLKDRHAITRQWFSVPATDATQSNLEKLEIEGVSILESRRHTRKLKRGTLKGNRFELKIRCFEGEKRDLEHRLQHLRRVGVPNYFGPQRFGHRGLNVQRGFELLQKGVRLKRNKAGIYLSAIRSFLFNQVLATRVERGDWNRIIDGELAMLDGSHSIFPCVLPDKVIEDRCKHLDIHPTGPMPGEHGTQPLADAAKMEQEVLQDWLELISLLASRRVKASRRALRLIPAELNWNLTGSDLELTFVLPPGAYATTVLREILLFSKA